jgi:hypothetical protein
MEAKVVILGVFELIQKSLAVGLDGNCSNPGDIR